MRDSLNNSLCEKCQKETEFILLDCEDGQSFAFCSWECLFLWKKPPGKRGRPKGSGHKKGVRMGKTIDKIPTVIALNKAGKSIRQIMKDTGLAMNTICSIINTPTPLEDYEPGCTREEFLQSLERACRPIKGKK